MKNSEMPAMPILNAQGNFTGLTKREYFAGMAMQGFLSESDMDAEDTARISCDFADALLTQLERSATDE